MANPFFGAGERVEINGNAAKIHSFDAVAAVILYDDDDRRECLSPEELYCLHRDGVLRVLPRESPAVPPDVILSATQLREIERIEPFLKALDTKLHPRSRQTMKKVIQEVGDEQGISVEYRPSASALYRKYVTWVDAERRTVALLRSRYVHKRLPRISDEIRRLIDDTLDVHFLVRSGKKLSECYEILELEMIQAGRRCEVPSKSFFYEFAAQLDPIEVTRFREGTAAARKKARRLRGRFMPRFLLERCELDALHLKVGLVDEVGNYIGSVIVFLLIDCYSRAVLGYSYSVADKPAEQAADAIECIKRALLPKNPEDYPYLENRWSMYGKCVELVMDASPAFSCRTMTTFLARLGITRHTPPTKEPWRRPFVERLNRTVRSQFANSLPGYVGSRGEARELDASMQDSACLTVPQFEQLLVEYLVDGYHQTSHRGLDDRTPAEVWAERVGVHCPRPLSPSDMDYVALYGGILMEGKRVHAVTGIELEGITYQSAALHELYWRLARKEDKPRVDVLLDPYDISTITVIDPETGEAISVDNVDNIEPGTTRRARKAAKQAGKAPKKKANPVTRDHTVIQGAEKRQEEARQGKRVRRQPDPEPMTEQTQAQLHEQLGRPTRQDDSPQGAPDPGGRERSDDQSSETPNQPPASDNFRIE